MSIPLRQSTDSQVVPFGYALDSTDGNTEETALTIANTDIKIWKRNATTLASKNSGGATHISNGIYYTTLDATDTNTLGALIIFIHVSGALVLRLECVVLPANVFDSLILGTDYIQSDTVQVAGTTATQTTTPTASEIADAVLDEATSGHTASGSVGKAILDASLISPPSASVIADSVWEESDADHVTSGTMGAKQTVNESKLTAIEGKVDTIDTNVDAANAAIVTIDSNVDAANTALATIDGKITALDTGGTDYSTTLSTIEGKIDTLDTNVDSIKLTVEATKSPVEVNITMGGGS